MATNRRRLVKMGRVDVGCKLYMDLFDLDLAIIHPHSARFEFDCIGLDLDLAWTLPLSVVSSRAGL